MPKSTYFCKKVLSFILQGESFPYLWINATTSPITMLYVSLHFPIMTTATATTQDYQEVDYPGYARVAVPRSSIGFSIETDSSGASAGFTSPIEFPPVPAGYNNTCQGFIIGTDATGPGNPIIVGLLAGGISLTEGVVPRIDTTKAISSYNF